MLRILGLDFGDKRIGVAVSDPLGITAQGITMFIRETEGGEYNKLADLVEELDVKKIVVGIPKNMDGSLGPQGEKVMEFVRSLKRKLKLPVETFDERLTTKQADNILIEAGLSRKKRKGVIDKVAGTIILQAYLDAQRRSE